MRSRTHLVRGNGRTELLVIINIPVYVYIYIYIERERERRIRWSPTRFVFGFCVFANKTCVV